MDIDKCFPKEATERISLPQLKILLLKGDAGDRTFPEKVSCENLRWLQWRCCPFPQLPDRLCSKELRVLDLSFSNIKDVPESLPNLLVLDLTGTKITELPDHFRSPSLRVLRLSRTEISKVPVLQNLETLELHSCKKFRGEFPYLPSLRHLGLSNCNDLTFLDVCNGGMTDLRHLDLRSSGLSILHKKMMKLSSLEHLNLQVCTSLETLSFLPTTLQKLRLAGCSGLQTVNLQASLPKLQKFGAEECRNLRTLPKELGSCMRVLALQGCDGLSELLATNQAALFRDLYSLQKLDLSRCMSLKTLSFLPTSLEELILIGCIELEVLDFRSGNFTNLKRLDIRFCPRLRSLPQELGTLPELSIERDDPPLTIESTESEPTIEIDDPVHTIESTEGYPKIEIDDPAHTIETTLPPLRLHKRRGLRSRIKSWVRRKMLPLSKV
ncbi:hypothetical protein KP509_15G017200 [Ceratopteris richardii]|uniref:Uncharacterized protein n=1 Tax=Ceratopteris richardii TaxID=49495 RepID=A0A8T2T310_CERRI|nr:hypothetical protein KP509_15G017200 [Ceratopteris richardii]